MALLLVLGAGYIGAELGRQALAAGHGVVLADNWYATERSQLAELEAAGARVETADIRSRPDVDRLLVDVERVFLLAAQASRPLADRDPDYTEATNVTGTRRVAEALVDAGGPPVTFASSLHVYGGSPKGDVGADHPYGAQSDLAHLSKIYGEQCLSLYARRAGYPLALMRLGIVYGPSPVEHDRPESQTVVDKFRRLAEAGQPLPVDDGGRATVGLVHVEDAARILLEAVPDDGVAVENVVAEELTVAGVAALAEGREPTGSPSCKYLSPFEYRHTVAAYFAR